MLFVLRGDFPVPDGASIGVRNVIAALKTYGAYGEKMMYGKKTVGVIRSTVWIGPDGKVRKHWARVGDAAKHPEQVLEALRGGE